MLCVWRLFIVRLPGYVRFIILDVMTSMRISGSNAWRYVNVPYVWPYFGAISPYIGLKNRPKIYGIGTSNQSVPESWPLMTCYCKITAKHTELRLVALSLGYKRETTHGRLSSENHFVEALKDLTSGLPSGKPTKSYWTWPSRNSGFTYIYLLKMVDLSIVFCMFTRGINPSDPSEMV